MITKDNILELQNHQGYPLISIFVNTHKTMPERLQDPIQVKDAVKEVVTKLRSEFDNNDEQLPELLKTLDNLIEKIDYAQSLNGLALFVGRNFSKSYVLPFKVNQKVIIDKAFATEELVRGLTLTAPYWLLSISHKPARLFKGQGDHLTEIKDDVELLQNMQGFPFKLNYDVTNDSKQMAYGVGDLSASYVTHQLDQFMHQLDNLLSKKIEHEHLPLIIMGTQKNRADFEKFTKHKKDIIFQIEGDYTHLSAPDIEKIIKPEMENYYTKENAQTLVFLNEAVGKEHCVFGVKDVWRQAHAGHVRILIIEEDYEVSGKIDEKNPDDIIVYEKSTRPSGYQSLTDTIVNQVFHSKGKVLFVKAGSLTKFEKIAAILWY